jgi:hypothetical protein
MTRSFWKSLLTSLGLGATTPEEDDASTDAAVGPDVPAEPPIDVSIDDRLPQSSRDRVYAIRALAADLELQCRQGSMIAEMIELQRLRTAHLPVLLRSYVAIPAAHRAEVFRETGRSASFILNERLDKILGRLHEMSRQLARGNLNEFTQTIRFVDMNYGSGPFD